MSDRLQALLCQLGVVLFLLGLLTGFGFPVFRSARIGISAHLAGIESGLALLGLGLLGSRLALPPAWAAAIAHVFWISLYVLFTGLVFAAFYGTGRTLPIAGAGLEAKPWQEAIARLLIFSGSIGSALAVVALLYRWSWRASD